MQAEQDRYLSNDNNKLTSENGRPSCSACTCCRLVLNSCCTLSASCGWVQPAIYYTLVSLQMMAYGRCVLATYCKTKH